MRIYFARHGESEANVTRTFSNRDARHPLTARGEASARDLAESLEGEGITAVYCSPVLRARQTAEIVGERLGVAPVAADGLRECDVGRWEGTSSAEGWAEHAEVAAAWSAGSLHRRVGGGESLADAIDRLRRWIGTVACAEPDARVLAISHGALLHAALPHVLAGLGLDHGGRSPLGYCDVVVAEADGAEMRCIRWGGVELD